MNPGLKIAVTLTARIVIGVIFVYASWDKIIHPFSFSANVEAYQILPQRALYLTAIGVAWLEMICGILLVTGVWTRTAAFMISVMLMVFIVGITRAMFLDLDISCGCFESGIEGDRIGWRRVFEDTLMLIASLWIVIFPKSPLSLWDGEVTDVLGPA